MIKNLALLVTLIVLLTGCSHNWKPLQSPCTYENRTGCGQQVPMQQRN